MNNDGWLKLIVTMLFFAINYLVAMHCRQAMDDGLMQMNRKLNAEADEHDAHGVSKLLSVILREDLKQKVNVDVGTIRMEQSKVYWEIHLPGSAPITLSWPIGETRKNEKWLNDIVQQHIRICECGLRPYRIKENMHHPIREFPHYLCGFAASSSVEQKLQTLRYAANTDKAFEKVKDLVHFYQVDGQIRWSCGSLPGVRGVCDANDNEFVILDEVRCAVEQAMSEQ